MKESIHHALSCIPFFAGSASGYIAPPGSCCLICCCCCCCCCAWTACTSSSTGSSKDCVMSSKKDSVHQERPDRRCGLGARWSGAAGQQRRWRGQSEGDGRG